MRICKSGSEATSAPQCPAQQRNGFLPDGRIERAQVDEYGQQYSQWNYVVQDLRQEVEKVTNDDGGVDAVFDDIGQ